MSSTETSVQNRPSRIAAALKLRWVRMTCLLSILVFELGFIWFILHFGWLESVNIWAQLGVVFVAILPLLVAGFFLLRKRFSLTSAMVAFTMFAVFMGITMRPVYEARQARLPAKLLSDSGARVVHEGFAVFDLESETPRVKLKEDDRVPMSGWMSRLVGDYADHPPATDICAVFVESDEQSAVFANVVDRLENIQGLYIGAQLSGDYASYKNLIRESGVEFLCFGTHNVKSDLRTNLNWLSNCSKVHSLSLMNISNDIDMILESDDLEIATLHLWTALPRKASWVEFADAKLVRNLKILTIQRCEISDAEARHFSKLENLKNLTITGNSLDGITFLHHLPELKIAQINVPLLTAKQLEDFVIPENLKALDLTVSSMLISESEADKFKASAPEDCIVYVTLR